MKFILGLLLSAAAAYACGLFLPWWTMAIAVFVVSYIVNAKALSSFLYGLLGVGLLWATFAFLANHGNNGILANRLGSLLGGLGGVSLVAVTALLGGLVAGTAAMSGAFLRGSLIKKKVKTT